MKTCSHCGTQNKDDAQKCVRCGLEMLAKGASKIGTMKSIVEARRFKTMTESFLRGIGAVEGKDALFPFQIDTTVGKLILNPDIFSINGRFQDVKRACEMLNPKRKWGMTLDFRDGAWRHNYYQSTMSAEQALDDFRSDLLPLLPQGDATIR